MLSPNDPASEAPPADADVSAAAAATAEEDADDAPAPAEEDAYADDAAAQEDPAAPAPAEEDAYADDAAAQEDPAAPAPTEEDAAAPANAGPSKGELTKKAREFIGAKIAKDFDGKMFIGEVIDARITKGGPLYVILYQDGDDEELDGPELDEGIKDYATLQVDMWEAAKELAALEEAEVHTLSEAGISNIDDLKLIVEAKEGGKKAVFEALTLPFPKMKTLYIVANYVTNGGIVTKDAKVEKMYSIHGHPRKVREPNNAEKPAAKATAAPKNKAGRPKKSEKKEPVKKGKPVKAKKPRGRPSKTLIEMEKEKLKPRPPPKSRGEPGQKKRKAGAAAAAPRTPKAARPSTAPERAEVYRGTPDEEIDGIEDWPRPGWVKVSKERQTSASKNGKKHVDHEWYSPAGNSFRSKIEVKKFLYALKQTNGDEAEAFKIYKTVALP
jgi:hypothetical protein